MRASRPAVHPVEAAPPPPAAAAEGPEAQVEGAAHPRGVRMKDPPGAPGTPAGLGLRLAQAFFAAAALAVMASTNDFPSVSAFRVTIAISVSSWNSKLPFSNLAPWPRLLPTNCMITGTITLGAACASAGITVLIGNDLNICAENHCASFETATALAFISWFALAPSCILNFWSMASR
ncbi:CASP-like protein 5A3 [Zea mays]|uniref:CASP-like protein 5A3 n=1 Tax=Zea mays TaxID=4577 RepID=A0A3L6EUW5_MAIZE|nr:CASP-like protein 5A3 [Zea mays]